MSEQTAGTGVMNIVLLGPPGAGKSTIAEAIAAQLSLVITAAAAHSAIGRMVAGYLEQGALVPDSLMDRLLRASLESLEADDGFLLDGYPRTIRQAVGLTGMLADYGRSLDAVLALDVEDEVVVRRLSGRRICEGAGDPFPTHIDDLASMLRCQERGGHLVQRDDDRPEIVRQRLLVYHEQTRPLLDFYADSGMLLRVDARGAPAEVMRRALAALPSKETP
jgi:adenylate kinase